MPGECAGRDGADCSFAVRRANHADGCPRLHGRRRPRCDGHHRNCFWSPRAQSAGAAA